MAEVLNPESLPIPPERDLHVLAPAHMDPSIPRGDAPQPSQDRLNASSQWVTAINTDRAVTHIVIDRFQIGQEILPGQMKKMEMLASDILYYLRRREPHQVARIVDGGVKVVTLQHPIDVRDDQGSPFVGQRVLAIKAQVAKEEAEREKSRMVAALLKQRESEAAMAEVEALVTESMNQKTTRVPRT